LAPVPVAGAIDEDAAHGLRCGGKEMSASVPVLLCAGADQAQIGLVDQGGGLERLSRLLVGELLGGELAQLVVDQRKEMLRGRGVALLAGTKDLCDVRQLVSVCRSSRAATGLPISETRERRKMLRNKALFLRSKDRSALAFADSNSATYRCKTG